MNFSILIASVTCSYKLTGPCSRGDEEAHFWCTTKIEPRLPLECCWDTLGRTRNKPTNSNSSKAIWGFNLSADWELILQIKCRVFASGDFSLILGHVIHKESKFHSENISPYNRFCWFFCLTVEELPRKTRSCPVSSTCLQMAAILRDKAEKKTGN